MRRTAHLTCAFALLAALAGCSTGVSGTPAVGSTGFGPTSAASTQSTASGTSRSSTSSPATSSGTGSADTSSADITLASGVTLEELKKDMQGAQDIVDGYWAKHWSDFYTGTYEPPTVLGLYDGTVADETPTCGGTPLEAYNASYCAPEDFVAWDVNLMVRGADVIGDTWVYLVIAHEWGHAIQERLDPSLVAQGDELQADCLGAAALFGAAADGTLTIEDGDEKEMVNSLSALADEMAWTSSADHGDPFQRVQWFTLGRNGGVNACHDVLETSGATDAPTSEALPTG
jgi:predicted metalloprotease